MSMHIRELGATEKSEFYRLADQCDSVFCSSGFSEAFGEAIAHFGIFNSQKKLIGGFSALRTRMRGISALIDPSYAPHCGLFVADTEAKGFKKNQQTKDLMQAVTTCLSSQKEKIISISFPPEFNDLQSALWNGFDIRVKYTYRLALEDLMESIIQRYDPKLRSSLQKYFSGEQTVDRNVKSDELIRQVRQMQQERNVRKKENVLAHIAKHFVNGNAKNSFATKLVHENELANVTLCIHDSKTCYYLLGALNKQVKAKNAGSVCLQHNIEEAQRRGLKIFDFEGSSIPAIESFFRSFGGELTPYFNVRKCPPLLKRFLK